MIVPDCVDHCSVIPISSCSLVSTYLPQRNACVRVEYCWSSAVWTNVDVRRNLHLVCGEELNGVSHSKLLQENNYLPWLRSLRLSDFSFISDETEDYEVLTATWP